MLRRVYSTWIFVLLWLTGCSFHLASHPIKALAGTTRCGIGPARPAPTSLNLTTPLSNQVLQRQDDNKASLTITGTFEGQADCVEARVTSPTAGKGTELAWTRIAGREQISRTSFSGTMKVNAGGWYLLEVSLFNGSSPPLTKSVVFGVGDVYLTAGQSNSTSCGSPPQVTTSGMVVAFNDSGWQIANDPQPIASADTCLGGSPWALLGDLLTTRYQVPIGFISLGWSGSYIEGWQPTSANDLLYRRLVSHMKTLGPGGFRAVLWHQGESNVIEAMPATAYQMQLTNLIERSRADSGYQAKWLVAHVSFLGSGLTDYICNAYHLPTGCRDQAAQDIRTAQQAVINTVPGVFSGPDTDTLGADFRQANGGVHFNGTGLAAHARLWLAALTAVFP